MLRSTTNEDNDPLLGGKDNHDDTLLSGTSNSSNNESGMNLALRIKSFKDVEIRINDASSVSQVKEAVRNALGEQADDRYLRLICKGRLLAPDTSALREFSVRNGDVLHAVLAAAVFVVDNKRLGERNFETLPWNWCGCRGRAVRAGADSDDDDDNNNGDSADEEEGRERIGFDRLRSTGLSRSEIAAIRSYFSRNVDRYVQAHPEVASEANESDNRRRRLLQEDAWMQAQGPTSEFRFNLNQNNPFLRFSSDTPLFRATTVGTDRDFLWGFLLGFFVGFLMLVWVWMPTVPHKQKLGILTGISFQLAMNFMKDNPDDAEFVED